MQGEGNPVVAQQLMEQMASLVMAATRMQAASRVLKNPGTFDGSDPRNFMSWKFVFTSLLNFGEPKFQKLLEKVEEMAAMPSTSDYNIALRNRNCQANSTPSSQATRKAASA